MVVVVCGGYNFIHIISRSSSSSSGARCSSMVRALAHRAMGRRIDNSWWTQ